MFAGRPVKAAAVAIVALFCVGGSLAMAGTASATNGVGASGDTVTNAAQASNSELGSVPAGTFDSGQPIDVVIPANSVFTPNDNIFILECSAPGGVDPSGSASCDGNTGYQGGTISVNGDGSVDVMDLNPSYPDETNGAPYTVYALPDDPSLGETSSNTGQVRPRVGQRVRPLHRRGRWR